MDLEEFNALLPAQAEAVLLDCCGSTLWAKQMAAHRPFTSANNVHERADSVWQNLKRDDWLEAFRSHPQIGENAATGSESHRRWAEGEQAGARVAAEDVKARMVQMNRAYREKFGCTFIVCATGKSAEEMLALLDERLQNDPADELNIAAEQQRLITRLRLEKLLSGKR